MTQASARPWTKNYPKGMPVDIDPNEFASVADMAEQSFTRFAASPAFSNMGHAISFAQLEVLSRHMAAYFQTTLKLQKGDRVVIQMPNLLQYPIALFGALRAGLTVINLNPLYTAKEMQHHIADSGASTIVILENFADKLAEIQPSVKLKNIILTEVGDSLPTFKRWITNAVVKRVKKMVPAHNLQGTTRWRQALALGSRGSFTKPTLTHLDIAFLQYTGGTTGVSKAAILTHGNIVANALQVCAWLGSALHPNERVVMAVLPLYHVFSLTVNCLGLAAVGCHNVLVTNPRDFPELIKILRAAKPHTMTAVSTLLGGLLNQPAFASLDLSTLRFTVAGAMSLNSTVAKAWLERTRSPVIEGYGLTEASPLVACNPLNGNDRLGTIGVPVPSTDVRVVDDDNKPVPVGQPGELCVKGPQVMQGYWNRQDETNKVIDAEGWLHTGDMAVLEEDGFLRIVDRKKDMILVSGFNVYPNEVEDVIMQHPKVLEAAAIGVPDEHSGEVVKVFVVKREGSLTAEELLGWAHDKLTGYKRPKHVEFRADLPKTNVGKILRRQLRS